MRSPARQDAHGRTVAERDDGDLAGRVEQRLDLPVAEAHPPRNQQLDRRREILVPPHACEAKHPVLGHRREAAAKVEAAAAGVPERKDRLGLGARERARAAGGELGQATQDEPAQRGRLAAQRSERDRERDRRRRPRGGHVEGSARELGDAEPPEGVLGKRSEQVVLLAQLARRLGDRALGGGVELLQGVEHVVAHAGAGEAAVGVGRVLAPGEVAGAQVVAHFCARDGQQRAHEPAAALGHAVQGTAARRDGEPIENGLSLVAGGVRSGVVALGQPLGHRVASFAGMVLKVAGGGQVDPLDVQWHAQPLAQLVAEQLVRIGALAQAVVDVQRAHARPEAHGDVEQADRVAAAGEQHQQRTAGLDQAAGARRLERSLGHSFATARQSWRGWSKPLSLT